MSTQFVHLLLELQICRIRDDRYRNRQNRVRKGVDALAVAQVEGEPDVLRVHATLEDLLPDEGASGLDGHADGFDAGPLETGHDFRIPPDKVGAHEAVERKADRPRVFVRELDQPVVGAEDEHVVVELDELGRMPPHHVLDLG